MAPQQTEGNDPPPAVEDDNEDHAAKLARRVEQLEERLQQLEAQRE